jgi:hypothetical protein
MIIQYMDMEEPEDVDFEAMAPAPAAHGPLRNDRNSILDSSLIHQAVRGVVASFEGLFDSGTTSGGDGEHGHGSSGWLTQAHDNKARFDLWVANIGARHTGQDKRSADWRLRDTPAATTRIVELLKDIQESHAELLLILSGTRADHGQDVSGGELDDDELALLSSQEPQSEAHELSLSVADSITSLLKVSALLRKATTRDRFAKAVAAAGDKPLPHLFDLRHVQEKYPKAAGKPWLLERLGRAITQRREYLRYIRSHRTKLAGGVPTAVQTSPHSKLALDTSLIPGPGTASDRPTQTATNASTVLADRISPQAFAGPIIEDDDDAYSSATTQASFREGDDDNDKLHVPSLKTLAKDGEPFECPYCMAIGESSFHIYTHVTLLTRATVILCFL